MKPRQRVSCPSPLRRVHKSAPRVALIVRTTRGRRGASVSQLSVSFLLNLARLRPAPPRLLRFYYDSFTRGVTRLLLDEGRGAVAPVLLFSERAASSADANRTKRNFSYAFFVLCETNGNTLNGIIVMKNKTPIKVIKRDERNRVKQATEEVKVERKSAQEAARDMVATVSEWVNEFQQKRRAETAHAFKTLLGASTPQTGKA